MKAIFKGRLINPLETTKKAFFIQHIEALTIGHGIHCPEVIMEMVEIGKELWRSKGFYTEEIDCSQESVGYYMRFLNPN